MRLGPSLVEPGIGPDCGGAFQGHAHLEKMESFIARPLLDPVEAAECSHSAKPAVQTVKLDAPKVGRNDPCPCGSGKKYKKCCGK
jgi:uncharacterized protein YecA (UPF0149 family)